MKSQLENNVLRLYLEGELNSYNADEKEKEINDEIHNKSFSTLVLNFSNLQYVSSAGLRIILKLKQKYDDTRIEEASLEVYDVLSMTGFVNIMKVSKGLKRIDVSNTKVIGEGFFSKVYRIDKDTIIKVFLRTSDAGQIERELKLAKQAFVLGIPTAISYDIVRVDDKLGVRYEMLDCISLKDAFLKYPEQYDSLLEKYVALLKKINTTEPMDPTLPNIKQFFIRKVEETKEFYSQEATDKLLRLLNTIPDVSTFIHGDCHFKNIMVQGNDFLLIDMDTLSVGHPMFELASIRAPYVAFEEDDPGNSEKFLGVPSSLCNKIYHDIVKKYYGDSQEVEDKIAILCYIHMVWWNKVNTPDCNARLEGCRSRLMSLIDKYDDLKVD